MLAKPNEHGPSLSEVPTWRPCCLAPSSSFGAWNLVPALAGLGDINGSGLLSQRRCTSAPTPVERLARTPPGDPMRLTFHDAVFVAALSDDQGHRISPSTAVSSLHPASVVRKPRLSCTRKAPSKTAKQGSKYVGRSSQADTPSIAVAVRRSVSRAAFGWVGYSPCAPVCFAFKATHCVHNAASVPLV